MFLLVQRLKNISLNEIVVVGFHCVVKGLHRLRLEVRVAFHLDCDLVHHFSSRFIRYFRGNSLSL